MNSLSSLGSVKELTHQPIQLKLKQFLTREGIFGISSIYELRRHGAGQEKQVSENESLREGKHVSIQFPPERWDWGGERDRRS